MDDSFSLLWHEALEERFGMIDDTLEVQSEGCPEIKVFYFEDLPKEGILTAVTCGLSNASHPDWIGGKPELIVSLETMDKSWGFAAGYFASALFGKKTFSYGDLFKLDDPFSDESEMNVFLAFAPSFLDQKNSTFNLPDRTIHLIGMYPLYDEEVEVYSRIGLKEFWHSEGFELYNPKRNKVHS
ncbi:MAG: hypothetical protein CME32_31635 [Gimesia sp.]|nr:hypothetical protein [Gimesia sp.]